MIGYTEIVKCYQYFYSKKYNSPNYIFKPSKSAENKIYTFLNQLDLKFHLASIGNNFIINYFLFQFNRVENLSFSRFSTKSENGSILKEGRIQIVDIIGKKALLYFVCRNPIFDYKLRAEGFYIKYQVSFNDIVASFKKEVIDISSALNIAEEVEKKRFHNSDLGISNCIAKTTLFNRKSKFCLSCIDKKSCKQILKNNYPIIYESRKSGL